LRLHSKPKLAKTLKAISKKSEFFKHQSSI
jgi:hypothetical protein